MYLRSSVVNDLSRGEYTDFLSWHTPVVTSTEGETMMQLWRYCGQMCGSGSLSGGDRQCLRRNVLSGCDASFAMTRAEPICLCSR